MRKSVKISELNEIERIFNGKFLSFFLFHFRMMLILLIRINHFQSLKLCFGNEIVTCGVCFWKVFIVLSLGMVMVALDRRVRHLSIYFHLQISIARWTNQLDIILYKLTRNWRRANVVLLFVVNKHLFPDKHKAQS